MDRRWMYRRRDTLEFYNGVEEFCKKASQYQLTMGLSFLYCPCVDCNNVVMVKSVNDIRDHVICRGFRSQYHVWVWHGEEGQYMGDLDGNDGRNRTDETLMGGESSNDGIFVNVSDDDDLKEDLEEYNDEDGDNDYLDEMMDGVHDDLENQPDVFESLSEAAKMPLYPGCKKYTKLSTVLTLFNYKSKYGWCDTSFSTLLAFLHEILPDGNEIPKSYYYAKKLMCPFGLEYKRIHACPNDCILYRNEYEALDECPRCKKSRYKRSSSIPGKKGPPAKVLWYLPIIPRFRRLFSIKTDAKNLRWHADGRKKDGMLKHPADSPQWKNIDMQYKTFGDEVRNLRLGLCTDGMNPFGTLSTQHSTWPVLLVIYNLPPWLCMKRKYIMLSLLITGPKQPGNDIDVYLEPLVDDLRKMWDEGVQVFDAHANEMFTLRAALMWTINDFPAYGNLSGYKNKGHKACPICIDDTPNIHLSHCRKDVYVRTRRLLRRDHPYRRQKKAFDGTVEEGTAPTPLTGKEVYDRVKGIQTVFGKPVKAKDPTALFKKESILWKLPYWKEHDVRHCLDVMHIEKNVCDALVGTLMNIQGKSKDGKLARLDLEDMGIRPELWVQKKEVKGKGKGKGKGKDKGKGKENGKGNETETCDGNTQGKRKSKGKGREKVVDSLKKKGEEKNKTEKEYLPPACYTLSKKEKQLFCECLYGIKVPSGYSSNIRRFVSPNGELKLTSMKSHDCHTMMQVFLPIAIRGILPKHVREAITSLCFFFNTICSKVVDPLKLDALQADVIVTLCKFEKYFPPSFFDIMVHLITHLVREIKMCGPVFMRWCYPFERHMGTLQHKVRNPAQPEGSMIQGTVGEEIGNFVAEFVAIAESIGLPTSCHEGRLAGTGTVGSKRISPDQIKFSQAHLFVLHHMKVVEPYIDEHMATLREKFPLKGERALMQLHNKEFVMWFRERVMRQMDGIVSDEIRWLGFGPRVDVRSFEGYVVNGYTFWTERQDKKSRSTQNSGVTLVATSREFASTKDKSPVDAKLSYYGRIQEIWELDYCDFKIGLFKCKWVDNIRRNVKHDDFTLVDLGHLRDSSEPFILATQAKQVFYVTDPKDPKWSIVLEGKRKIVGIGDVDDENEYDAFEDSTSFIVPTPIAANETDNNGDYMRLDHAEGILQ